LIADAHVLGCGTDDPVGSGEAGQCRENAACPTLTSETVANTDTERLAVNFNPQLAAGAGRGSRMHSAPRAGWRLHFMTMRACSVPITGDLIS
jgi:hypothetical protein